MYREMNLENAARLIEMLGGAEKVAALLSGRSSAGFKYGALDFGQVEALCNKLGGIEKVFAIVRGERKVTLADAIQLLVDQNGRCIPQSSVTASVCDPNKAYFFDRTGTVDFTALAKRAKKLFGNCVAVDGKNLEKQFVAIKEMVSNWPTKDRSQIANLFAGPHFPVVLPKRTKDDYGKVIESTLLPVLAKAYEMAFPGRQFVNYKIGELAKQVEIIDDGHRRLWDDLGKGQVAGILCYPMHGFSVDAQRQFSKLMPDFISLAGPYEAIVATSMWPKQLARDFHTPVQDYSAVSWQSPSSSLCLNAPGGKLAFSGRFNLGFAGGNCSGGLFVRG
ncbi:MAG: hypothetical protein V1763_01780 [Parcubacteria group bacterium]